MVLWQSLQKWAERKAVIPTGEPLISFLGGKTVPKKNGVFFGWFLLGLKMDDGHIPKFIDKLIHDRLET